MKIIRVTAMWCMSCLVMKKVWKKAFSDYQNIEIIDYDFDDDEEKLKDLNIGNILPLLIFYKESKEIKRIAGEKSLKQMQEILSEIYDA
jgi:thiol:disulfide interchange protein